MTLISRAAALATGCKIKLTYGVLYYDLRQNAVLGELIGSSHLSAFLKRPVAEEFADVIGSRYGYSTNEASTTASTDFVSVHSELFA